MAPQRLTTKAAELVTPSQTGSGKFVDAILLTVEGTQTRIFALLTVQGEPDAAYEQLARIVGTQLEQAHRAITEEANVARCFEMLLADLNAAFAAFAAEHPSLALKRVECIVGILTEAQLFVSGFGNLLALFLHKTADRRFVIYELHAQLAAEAELSWEKPFVTILDGELHPGDIFYIATRAPAHAIALSDLQDVLVTLPPAGALERVQQFLPPDVAYGALCFHVAEEERIGPPKKTNPIASIAALGQTKSETADLLGEQGADVSGFVRRVVALLSAKLTAPGSRGYKSMLKRMARFTLQFLGAVIVALIVAIKFILRMATTLVVRIFRTSKSGSETRVALTSHLRSLPPSAKYIAGGAITVILLLVVSISFMSRQGTKRAEEETFATTSSTIEEKTNAAEASLLYDDTAKASTLMNEAAALLETLPSDNRAREERITALRSALAALQAKIRRETPVTLATIAELGPNEVAMDTFTTVNGALYAFAKDGDLLRVNELEKTFSQELSASGAVTGIRTTVGENANMLLIDSNRRLGRADLAAKTIRPITSGVEGMASAEDLTLYNSALYVLSAASQQIVLMRAQGDGFEAGTPWISNRSSDLTKARDLTIDGSVFVLTDSDVIQFKSKNEVTWVHDTFSPALVNPTDIWTDVESKYLYILDPGSSRVLVYEKSTGKLAMQYTAPEFSGAIGFAVREKDNQIIVATGTKIASFTATHLLQ